MRRRQYLFSHSPIPNRTLRRIRERQRLVAAAANQQMVTGTHSLNDQVGQSSSGMNCQPQPAAHGDYSFKNFPASSSHDVLLESPSEERRDGGICEELSWSCSSDDASSECSSSSPSSSLSSGSASEDEEEDGGITHLGDNNQSSPESCCPEEDDLTFWDTPSGHDIYLSAPLSPATETTRGDALLMCLALGFRHSLSWAAIEDILKMINCLFGQEAIKATKYFFLKYMEGGKGQATYHMFCHYCHRYLGSKEELGDVDLSCRCGKSLKTKEAKKSFFVTLSLEEQLKELLRDKTFVDSLQYRFKRKKCQEDAYEDIFDGERYKALSGPDGPLSQWYNLSYCFNTDGFPVGGKSGKQTCWPIFVRINELPPHLRSKFMLLAGLYVGKHDPNMQLYLQPFVQEANDLATVGINWYFNNKKINTKLIPLAACVDTPARSKILNMTQFSGKYGCTICPNKPESRHVGMRHTLPLNAMHERTHEGILMDAALAHANKTNIRNRMKRRVRGVKGPSPLHNLLYFDVVKCVRPDIMHSILLGNGRHHISVMHSNAGRDYYIGADVTMLAINNRLKSIKPPKSIPKVPRDFNLFGSWKANEWLEWILFYAVPCLHGIIPNRFVAHFAMLSSALHVFLSKSISPEDLEKAHVLVVRYVQDFQEYFGKDEMVFNIHLLLHMKNSIRFLGPSFTNMAFCYEGENKHMLELKKGTSNVAQEMVAKYLTFKALPLLCEKFASCEETVEFCQSLSGRSLLKTAIRVENIVLAGRGKRTVLDGEEAECLAGRVFAHLKDALCFQKFFKDRIRFSTASYSQSNKTDDSYISVCGETKARIKKIIQHFRGDQQSVYLLVRELLLDDTPIFGDELGEALPIVRVAGEGRLLAITPDDISSQCIAMNLENGNYISDITYGWYYGDS